MKLRPIIVLSFLYIILSFVYSSIGLFHGELHAGISEYTISFLIPEISGHVLFAVAAILPFLDVELIVLSIVVALFIDLDHLLGTLTHLPFIGRPNHSILFILVAASLFTYFSGRMKLERSFQVKIAFVVPVAILSHLSYDVLAAYVIFGGGAFTFPIFYPFSSALIAFPLYSFVVLEIAAFGLASLGALYVRRIEKNRRRVNSAGSTKKSTTKVGTP